MKKENQEKKSPKTLSSNILVNKKCPICKISLESAILCNTEIDYCPRCFGLWFEEDELRWAKDEKDKDLNWLDIDLWKDPKKFKVSYGIRLCPSCRLPLYEVYYGDSKIIVDVCNICKGVWLDRGEFKKIIDYLKEKQKYEILNNYSENLLKQGIEIFLGPDSLKEEISDFLTVLKFLKYNLIIKHPTISKIISELFR
ncbi:MAG TPA: zf-TFIIB domain-containing protein [Candidatus Pacearchaeota archaeon]|nr:zf-TFIIB domain-containing protein [Candidatus Pacearchaeota archaeon]HOL90268.1 zf-TFIIB domain-containing protein [Candidatus Pacearchaeota archaeon]